MNQLNLFSNITCVHCGANPGPSPKNPHLWAGFVDQDTGEHVCRLCRSEHYRKKAIKLKLKHGMLYSEVPVVLNQTL